MGPHEQQERELSILANTKNDSDLFNIADECCDTDDIDAYWDTVDGISLGLRKGKSKQKLFSVEYKEQGQSEPSLIYLFIAESAEEVKQKIEKCKPL